MKLELSPLLVVVVLALVASGPGLASAQRRGGGGGYAVRRGNMADGHESRGARLHAESPDPTPPERQRRRGLSIKHFGDVLFSETENEYTDDDGQLTEEETMALWDAASEHEWDRAYSADNVFAMGTLSVNGTTAADPSPSGAGSNLFPFLVCDPEIGKCGNDCRQGVAHHFGDHLMAVSNTENMTCFVASACASTAENAPDGLLVHPFMPEAKLQRGLVDQLVDAVDAQQQGSYAAGEQHNSSSAANSSLYHNNSSSSAELPRLRLYSLFCPGRSSSPADAERIVEDIMGSLLLEEGEVSASSSSRQRFLQLINDDDDSGEGPASEGKAAKVKALAEALRKKRKSGHRRHRLLSSAGAENNLTTSCAGLFSMINTTADPNSGDSFTITLTSLSGGGSSNDTSSSSSPSAADAVATCLLRLVNTLSVRPEVCSVGLLPDMTPNNADAQWIIQSGVRDRRPFFEKGVTGVGEVVACSDSGLDVDQCYFHDEDGRVQFGGAIDLSRRKVVQYVNYADRTDDYYGHGTHVVGTILGRRSDDGRTERDGTGDGVARDAKVAFFDIGRTNTWFLDIPGTAKELFDPGKNAGARIHSASWGSNFNGYGFDERGFDAYMRDNDDFVVVIAAGNSGSRRNTVGSPATCKNGISVGASGNGNSKDNLARFSSRGPTADGRTKPDVVAPGDSVLSAAAGTQTCGDSNALFQQSGTSMSAPVVSGTCALIRQYFRDGYHPGGRRGGGTPVDNPSGQLVKAVLLNGAQSLNGLKPYDVNQNFGLVSLIHSLPLEGENTIGAKVVDRKNIRAGRTDTIVVEVDTSKGCTASEISATLCWADPPAFASCRRCVLNDLDLYITKEGDSRTYFANGGSGRDTTNNAERVRVPVANGDRLTIHVEATNLEENSQNYALVVTGCIADGQGNPPQPPSPPAPTPPTPGPPSPTPEPPVQAPVPAPVQPPTTDDSLSIETTLAGQKTWDGNMFDVRAKTDLVVSSMSFHTESTQSMLVEVWTKRGTLLGSEWTLAAAANVIGRGRGQLTEIPPDGFDEKGVIVEEGETLTFYVTSETPDSMIMSEGTALFEDFAENDHLVVREGFAATHRFGAVFYPYVWNGRIDYSLGGAKEEKSIMTEMVPNTAYFYYGYFFEVEVTAAPISIYEMDIHTYFVGDMLVDVWIREGTYNGYEDNVSQSGGWTQVVNGGLIRGLGRGVWTPIPETLFNAKVAIPTGSTMAFYVEISEDALLYSDGGGEYENDDGSVIIRTGKSKGPSGLYGPRTPHVVLRYRV